MAVQINNIQRVVDLPQVDSSMISHDDLLVLYENNGSSTNKIDIETLKEHFFKDQKNLGYKTGHVVNPEEDPEYGELVITQADIYTDDQIIDNFFEQGIKLKVNEENSLSTVTRIKGVNYEDGIITVNSSSDGLTKIPIQKGIDESSVSTSVDKLIFTGDGVNINETSNIITIDIPGNIKVNTGSEDIEFSTLKAGSNVNFSFNEDNTVLTISSTDKDTQEIYKLKTYYVISIQEVQQDGTKINNYQLSNTDNPNPTFTQGEVISVYFNDNNNNNTRSTSQLFHHKIIGMTNESPYDLIDKQGIFVYTKVNNEDVFQLISSDKYLYAGRVQAINKIPNSNYITFKFYGQDEFTVLDSLPTDVIKKGDIYTSETLESGTTKDVINPELLHSSIPQMEQQNGKYQISMDDLPAGVGTIVINAENIEEEIPISGNADTLVFSTYADAQGSGTSGGGYGTVLRGTCGAPTSDHKLLISENIRAKKVVNNCLIILKVSTASSDDWKNLEENIELLFYDDDGVTTVSKGFLYCDGKASIPGGIISNGDTLFLVYTINQNELGKFYLIGSDDVVSNRTTITKLDSDADNLITLNYKGSSYKVSLDGDYTSRTLNGIDPIYIEETNDSSVFNIGLDLPDVPSEGQTDNRENLYLNGTGEWSQISTDTLPFENGVLLASALPLDVLIPIIHPVGSCYETDDPDFAPNNLDWSSANNYFLTTAERDAGIRWELIDQKDYTLQSVSGGQAPITIYKWFKRQYIN